MCGTTSLTISPSSRTSSLSTPCVEGCCGPRLMINSSSFRSSAQSALGSDLSRFSSSNRYWTLFNVFSLVFNFNTAIVLLVAIVFSQRVAFPVGRKQDSSQIGMIGEAYSKEVIGFPFVPVRGSIHRCNRRHLRIIAGHYNANHQMMIKRDGIEVVDHFHRAGFRAVIKAGKA